MKKWRRIHKAKKAKSAVLDTVLPGYATLTIGEAVGLMKQLGLPWDAIVMTPGEKNSH